MRDPPHFLFATSEVQHVRLVLNHQPRFAVADVQFPSNVTDCMIGLLFIHYNVESTF